MDYSNRRPGAPAAPAAVQREIAPYSRVRGGTRYTQVAAGRKRRRNIILGVVAAIVCAVLVGLSVAVANVVGFYNSIGSRLNANVTAQTKAVLADQRAAAQEITSNWTDMSPFYMLLLGVDSNSNRMGGEEAAEYGTNQANYRTDTIILTRVDPGNKKVTLVSIHRDTWYPIDGVYQKINNAYSLGGTSKTIEVISEFAGVPITHFAEVNLDGFYAIVDALGGVEVDVPYDINDEYTGWTLSAGLQTLNGEDAEVFVRSRHAYDDLGDGDRYRSAHQRLFLAAVLDKLMSSSPAEMIAAVDTLANYVNTDFTPDQIVNLALAMRGIDMESDVYSTMNPTEAVYRDNTWYEMSQDSYWHELMAQVDSGERPDVDTAYRSVSDDFNSADYGKGPSAPADTHVVVKNASGSVARGTEVASALQSAGWAVDDQGEANLQLDETVVVYEEAEQEENAQTVAAYLGVTYEPAGTTWTMQGDIMVVVGTH